MRVLLSADMEGATGVRRNDVPGSEGYMNAALAAEFGASVVLVTGDDRAVEDAKSYASHAQRVAVERPTNE